MNGAAHYAEAERLLAVATKLQTDTLLDPNSRAQLDSATAASASITALAQVHATLALAAATKRPTPVGVG